MERICREQGIMNWFSSFLALILSHDHLISSHFFSPHGHHIIFYIRWSTSARTGEYVDDGFALLISHILEADKQKRKKEEEEDVFSSTNSSPDDNIYDNKRSIKHKGREGGEDKRNNSNGAFKIGSLASNRHGRGGESWMGLGESRSVCW
jgi:hypothetical protein